MAVAKAEAAAHEGMRQSSFSSLESLPLASDITLAASSLAVATLAAIIDSGVVVVSSWLLLAIAEGMYERRC